MLIAAALGIKLLVGWWTMLCNICGQYHTSAACPMYPAVNTVYPYVCTNQPITEPSSIEIKLDRIIWLLERQNSELESIRIKLRGGVWPVPTAEGSASVLKTVGYAQYAAGATSYVTWHGAGKGIKYLSHEALCDAKTSFNNYMPGENCASKVQEAAHTAFPSAYCY